MAGSNAFAFTGTAFVPEDRDSTASMSVRTSPTVFSTVSRVYTLSEGVAATQVWIGFPPVPTAPTYRNERTGTFPNLNNAIQVDWTCETSALIASFDVFVKIGTGTYSIAANVSSATRTYNYGVIPAGTTYSFYVRANGVSGLTTTSTESSTSLAAPGVVSNLRETSISPSSLTWTWDVTGGVYQKFDIYRWNGSSYVYNTTLNATESGTSFTHTWSGLSERTSYSIRVYGYNRNGHWSGPVDDTATTSNAAPSAPSCSATATDVASEPAGNTNTAASATRYFSVVVDPSDDPIFAQVYLEVSDNGVNWSEVTSWIDNTNSKTHNYAVTVTSTSTGVTRYFRARQRDNQDLYSGYTESGAVTSDTLGSTYVYNPVNEANGTLSNEYVLGQNLGVTSWAVTSTFGDNVQDYGGDQAFDGDQGKAWRSKSVTNARIRITFPISGNWNNGISAIQFWPAAAYTTYISLSADGGSTWFGSTNTPGTGDPYVELIPSSSITPNQLNTIDISPDRYKIQNQVGLNSYSWAVRLEFTATTARTFEVNQINVKQLTQNYRTVDRSYYRYW
jgi:hypothetical protein